MEQDFISITNEIVANNKSRDSWFGLLVNGIAISCSTVVNLSNDVVIVDGDMA